MHPISSPLPNTPMAEFRIHCGEAEDCCRTKTPPGLIPAPVSNQSPGTAGLRGSLVERHANDIIVIPTSPRGLDEAPPVPLTGAPSFCLVLPTASNGLHEPTLLSSAFRRAPIRKRKARLTRPPSNGINKCSNRLERQRIEIPMAKGTSHSVCDAERLTPHSCSPYIIDTEQLRYISGKRTPSAVRRWASARGIRVLDGNEGPWTTLDAINHALGINSTTNNKLYGSDIL